MNHEQYDSLREIIECDNPISNTDLAIILKATGLSQAEIAAMTDRDPSTISKYRTGLNPISQLFSKLLKQEIGKWLGSSIETYPPKTPRKLIFDFLPTEFNLGYWLIQPFVPDDIVESAANADVVLVPWEGFKDYRRAVFPVGTMEFFQFVEKSELSIEACISDKEYTEIALHSDEKRLPSMIVTFVVLPLVLSLVGNYISQRWPLEKNPPISVSITVQEVDGSARTLEYKGSADDFERIVLNAAAFLQEDKESKQ